MSDSNQIAETAGAELWIARRDHELLARFEHLRALNSAWAVLAPFGLWDEGQHIVGTGRAVSAELARLAGQPFESRDPNALPKLDTLLGAIEGEMLALAFEVPVAQLRASLPARLADERRGLLDLLDLMLLAETEGRHGMAGRISAIDYMITLLCTGGADGDGSVLLDPVGLSPRLHALCERAGGDDDSKLAQIAAEFHAAANVCEDDARDEIQLRALRRRKRELGASFFAPRVVRAIVTYNAALSRCISRGVWDSRDWGSLPGLAEPSGTNASVFETEALPRLAEALRRRAEGDAPTSSAVDRVAWCLDLSILDETERAALLSPSAEPSGDLEGTAILVGLLCRSAVILEGELPAIGISPETLSGEWVRELDAVLKREVNERIAGDAYKEACALSELRTRFLYSLRTGGPREPRPATPVAEPLSFGQVDQEARQLAGEALEPEETKPRLAAREARRDWHAWPWAQLGRFGGAAAVVGLLALGLAHLLLPGGELDYFSGAELDRVSPYLVRGMRNGEGKGPAFVGRVGDDWARLEPDRQQQAAAELVAELRAEGVREIMVFDEQRRLRIQALGQQPARVLPAPSPPE